MKAIDDASARLAARVACPRRVAEIERLADERADEVRRRTVHLRPRGSTQLSRATENEGGAGGLPRDRTQ